MSHHVDESENKDKYDDKDEQRPLVMEAKKSLSSLSSSSSPLQASPPSSSPLSATAEPGSAEEEPSLTQPCGRCIDGSNLDEKFKSQSNDIVTGTDTAAPMTMTTISVTSSDEPDDDESTKHNLARWVFVLLGIGVLLPWNSFVSAEGYFEMRLCDDNNETIHAGDVGIGGKWNGEPSSFILWFGFIYNGFGVAALGIMLLVHKRQRRRRKWRAAKGSAPGDDDETDYIDDESDNNADDEGTIHDACSLQTNPIPEQHLPEVEAMEFDSPFLLEGRHPQDIDHHNNNNDSNNKTRSKPSAPIRRRKPPPNSTIENLRHSNRRRILIPLCIYLLVFILTTSLIPLPTTLFDDNYDHARILFLSFTLAGVAACGAAGAVASAGLVSFANLFPERVGIQNFVLGQAVGGALLSILNLGSGWWMSGGKGDGGRKGGFWAEHCGIVIGVDGFDADYGVEGSRRSIEPWDLTHITWTNPSAQSRMVSETIDTSSFTEEEVDYYLSSIIATDTNSAMCPEYHVDWGAFIYFAIGCVLLLGCICFYAILDRQPITKYYRTAANNTDTKGEIDGVSLSNRNDIMDDYSEHDDGPFNWLGWVESTDGNDSGISDGCYSDEEDNGEQEQSFQDVRKANSFGDMGILWSAGLFAEDVDSSLDDTYTNPTAQNDQTVTMNMNMMPTSSNKYPIDPPLLDTRLREHGNYHQLSTTLENLDNDDEESDVDNITSYVWRRIRWPIISIFLTFFITLTVFPSWIAKIESSKRCEDYADRWNNDLFVPRLIVLFNIGDLVGRMSCNFFVPTADDDGDNEGSNETGANCSAARRGRRRTHSFCKKLAWASFVRVIFLPLFWLCTTSSSSYHTSQIIDKILTSSIMAVFSYADIYPQLVLVAFAFTNGLLTAMSYVCVPRLIPSTDEFQKVASTILNFTIGLGLFCGSLFSFVYVRWGNTVVGN